MQKQQATPCQECGFEIERFKRGYIDVHKHADEKAIKTTKPVQIAPQPARKKRRNKKLDK
jgi:hypothetical protein